MKIGSNVEHRLNCARALHFTLLPREKIQSNWKTQTLYRKFEESKKRIGIKVFHESKGITDCTELITTNIAFESQSNILNEYNSSAGKHKKILPKTYLTSLQNTREPRELL